MGFGFVITYCYVGVRSKFNTAWWLIERRSERTLRQESFINLATRVEQGIATPDEIKAHERIGATDELLPSQTT